MADDNKRVFLLTQSDIKPGKQAEYGEYIKKTMPLMAKYGGSVVTVGSGLNTGRATNFYANNAVLSFPNQQAMEDFFNDPDYQAASAEQKEAVENLHTAHFVPRNDPEPVGRRAFEHFQHGLATGEWDDFLAMLTDDFTFYFPKGKFAGEHTGKDKAAEFFGYVSTAYPEGLHVTNLQTVATGKETVMFEFQDEGKLFGEPYHGRVVIAFDVRGDQISGYREYFGTE